MSLLLDALKKAAEQKAANSGNTDIEAESVNALASNNQTITKVASDPSEFDPSEVNFDNENANEPVEVADDPIAGNFDDDDTLVFSDDDVTAFMGDDTLLRRERDAVTGPTRNEVESETNYTWSDIESDDTGTAVSSTSLFNEEDTITTAEATRQANESSEKIEIELELAPQTEVTKSLNLVDVPNNNGTEGEVGRSDVAVEGAEVLGLEPQTTTPREETTTTRESTSTGTFAADNYDRTLRRPSNDDASNLFAGLRSDSDVVMTPEYAKSMFLSKSSEQRRQNIKIYSGTALAILVVIAVLGVSEIEQKTLDIDNRLRSLKRDPMPGLIKNRASGTFTDVFAAEPGSEVDAATLQLIENADSIIDTEIVVAVEPEIENEGLIENTDSEPVDSEIVVETETETETETATKAEDQSTLNAKVESNVDSIDSVIKGIEEEPAQNRDIQIVSKSGIAEKDRWLRQAYAAYQRGDDQNALLKYNAVLDVDPGNRNALLARAAINIQNNRIAEAIRDYRTLLIANPKDSLAMSSMIAVTNYSPEISETQLKLMIRDEPDSPYLNFALGNVFGAQDRWQEAQGQYFVALENNPDDPNYAYNLAVSLEHIAQPGVAIIYYERALNNFTNGLATFNRDIVDARLEMLRQL